MAAPKTKFVALDLACLRDPTGRDVRALLEEEKYIGEQTKLANIQHEQFKWTVGHMASERGHTECIRVVAEFGADLSAPNYDGKTPAHKAAGATDDATAHATLALLDELGANMNYSNYYGDTPLHYVCCRGFSRSVRLLCEILRREPSATGADLLEITAKQKGLRDHTPEEGARAAGFVDCADLLKELVAAPRGGTFTKSAGKR
jgi:Ankyrin repeats (3 copies)/Ankyrin repeat